MAKSCLMYNRQNSTFGKFGIFSDIDKRLISNARYCPLIFLGLQIIANTSLSEDKIIDCSFSHFLNFHRETFFHRGSDNVMKIVTLWSNCTDLESVELLMGGNVCLAKTLSAHPNWKASLRWLTMTGNKIRKGFHLWTRWLVHGKWVTLICHDLFPVT